MVLNPKPQKSSQKPNQNSQLEIKHLHNLIHKIYKLIQHKFRKTLNLLSIHLIHEQNMKGNSENSLASWNIQQSVSYRGKNKRQLLIKSLHKIKVNQNETNV